MPKKKTTATIAKADSGAPIYIYYKGARYELKIVNSVIARFRKLIAASAKKEHEPEEQFTLLLMAMLKLKGEAEDHIDEFESILKFAPKVQQAMERFENGTGTPGEPAGGSSAQPPVSATD